MIPEFDEYGLLPAGIHDCTLDEIESRMCWNARRAMLMDSLRLALADERIDFARGLPLVIDGSFVRDKPHPDDIDIVIDASSMSDHAALTNLIMLRIQHDDFKTKYNVDLWSKHPMIPNDLVQFFQYLGDKAAALLRLDQQHPKGVLRITL